MGCCRETTKMDVPARHRESARSGEAGGPPGNQRVLVSVPKRYVAGEPVLPVPSVVAGSLSKEHPRTTGRAAILFAIAALRSVPRAGSQFRGRSK
jgi:hypothetical protein